VRVALLVPAGFALGAAACAYALRQAPAAISTDLAQPVPVVTYWQSFGALMWFTLFGALAFASIGYITTIARIMRGERVSIAVVAIISASACAAALAFPVVFSSDVYAYAGYGAMALHGMDAYSHARVTIRDPILDAMLWQWGNPPPLCVYGPAFLLLAKGIVATVSPLGPAATLWAFRLLACAAFLACIPFAYVAFAPLGRSRALLAATGIALNPLAIWACAEGHNDSLAVAAVLASFVIVVHRGPLLGALLATLTTLMKAPAIMAAAGLVLYDWSDRRLRVRVLCGTFAGALAAAALAAPLWAGFDAHIARAGSYFPQFSLQYVLATLMPVPLAFAITIIASATLLVAGAYALYARRTSGAIPVAIGIWLLVPNPYPWYVLWIIPLAFLADDACVVYAIIAASLLMIFRYYGDATTLLSIQVSDAIALVQLVLPLIVVMGGRRYRARRDLRESRTRVPGFATLRFP
jgi:hypothetical protein